ncbi:MAG: hypothetical protein IJT68_08745 [Lentisphaeria bacterium]|nr:hypothetical protein [Lentisphaeria bacterium]
MNQKTRTALYSLGLCACIISAATAVILTINARNRKPQAEVTAVEEPQEEEPSRQDRPRRRGRRGGGGGGFHESRRGDVTRLLPDGDDFGQVPTPEEFEEELVKGLEEYRALAPHERARLNDQMHQTTLFVRSGLDMMRENIHEIPPEELDRIRDDFDRFSDAAEQTFFSGIVEQYLTPEEDATIGEFVRTMHDATNEFRDLLHST